MEGASQPVIPCEEFACADIDALYARWVRVQENVGIGVPRGYQVENELEVNGVIVAEEVLVQPNVADYVFAPGYNLKSLKFVEEFITKHHHLPGVPSASAVRASGGTLGIGESYRVLLEKVEELTLYTIQQNKRILALESLLTERPKAEAPNERFPQTEGNVHEEKTITTWGDSR
jgi:hypothetical protein